MFIINYPQTHYTFQLQISSNRKKMYLCWRTHTVHSHTHPQCSGFLFLLHCSIKGQGPSAVAPRVLTSRNITFVYSVRTKVLPNELRCHFLYLVCVCVCVCGLLLNQQSAVCWSGSSIPLPQLVLWEGGDMLRAASALVRKKC